MHNQTIKIYHAGLGVFLSIFSGITIASDSQTATQGYVNYEDSQVAQAIEAKGGSIAPLDCTKYSSDAATATQGYVNACDKELLEAINTLPSGSLFSVGDALCGSTYPWTCPVSGPQPWGIVIYADPNPTDSQYYGLAMSIADVSSNVSWGSTLLTSCTGNTTDPNCADVGANDYSIYGGINNTTAINQYCIDNPSYCTNNAASAFLSCNNYAPTGTVTGDWYLPSIAEMTVMFTYAQTESLPLSITGVEVFERNVYWSSTQYSGGHEASQHGNLGYSPYAGSPSTQAVSFGFSAGTQATDNKFFELAVRCVRALPI